ncbi:MAG: aspartate carbamoyltransferase catalytic subunit [Bdellovibrionaceae bacterium]|nr:aspartate carbamoyltransferase catalytic subunit [Pseudobdellovibrionaceae bacterium]
MMSFVSISDLSLQQVESIFINSDFFKTKNANPLLSDVVVANVFFEPSTRTRMSFEMAALRLGAKSILFNGKIGSSLEKEETYIDTVLNIAAMKPDMMVIRSNDELSFTDLKDQIDVPVINAGWGTKGHPTQALLDIATLRAKNRPIAREKILFIGDIKHSRVVSSHLELAKILNYEVAFCGPETFLPPNTSVKVFSSLKDGLAWATAAIFLRFQKERHQPNSGAPVATSPYQLNVETLKLVKNECVIMHPGPVNWGVEMTEDVLKDPRCLILDQVNQGVYVRMALIYLVAKRELV